MFFAFMVFGLLAGLLCGVAPAMMANKKGRSDLATNSYIICGITGFIGGLLLAVPATLIMIAVVHNANSKT
jgi:hypothetical protein